MLVSFLVAEKPQGCSMYSSPFNSSFKNVVLHPFGILPFFIRPNCDKYFDRCYLPQSEQVSKNLDPSLPPSLDYKFYLVFAYGFVCFELLNKNSLIPQCFGHGRYALAPICDFARMIQFHSLWPPSNKEYIDPPPNLGALW